MNTDQLFVAGSHTERAQALSVMLAAAREKNDAVEHDAVETAALRGEIRVLKRLHGLLTPAAPVQNDGPHY